jgi:polyhydroxyalkanoate synthesis regulator phasin
MVQFFTKGTRVGIGLALLTIEKAVIVVKKTNGKTRVKKEEAKKTVGELIQKAESATKDIRILMDSVKQSAMSKLDIPSRTEIKNLENRIRELETKDNQEASRL